MTDLLKNIEELSPLIRERAFAAEQARRPDDDVIAALCEIGLFRHFVPKRFGGHEGTAQDFAKITQALSAHDASHGWVASFYMEHNWMVSLFPLQAQEEAFAARGFTTAPACVAPTGNAELVGGGYRINGQWAFGTGICHADWVLLACPAPDLGMGFFLLPVTEIEMLDTWHMAGMAATGSNDIKVENVFVPKHRAISLVDMAEGRAPGAALYDGAMYRIPMAPFLASVVGAVAAGAAQGAVHIYQKRLEERLMFGSGEKQVDRPLARARLARADADARLAALAVSDVIDQLVTSAENGTAKDLNIRAAMRIQTMRAVEIARSAVQELAAGSGATAQQTHHPLQRALRDVTVLSAHAVVEPDTITELHGRMKLGMDPNTFMI
ncbi:MAG: acyl-CoA dehydrogenase family protein [Alphaproteobacteria bacterium]